MVGALRCSSSQQARSQSKVDWSLVTQMLGSNSNICLQLISMLLRPLHPVSVGEVVGSELMGETLGEAVGSALVSELVGELVVSELVGDLVGEVVGSELTGEELGAAVGSELAGELAGELVESELMGALVGEVVSTGAVVAVGALLGSGVGQPTLGIFTHCPRAGG